MMTVREATSEDIPELVRIINAAFRVEEDLSRRAVSAIPGADFHGLRRFTLRALGLPLRGRRFTPFHYDRVGTEVGGGTARAGEDGAADPRPISADGFGGPPSGPPDTEPQRLV